VITCPKCSKENQDHYKFCLGCGAELPRDASPKAFSPQKPGPDKNAIYECGLESKGDAWVQFRSEYYLYGIIFLIFDVETIFLLPFAVAFTGLSAGAFVAMVIFLLLLVEGLVWAWRKGVLTWK